MLARSNKLNIERGKDMRNDELNLKELEKELTALQMMVRMRLLNMEQLEERIEYIGNKYNMNIILRERNRTTNQTTIKVLA